MRVFQLTVRKENLFGRFDGSDDVRWEYDGHLTATTRKGCLVPAMRIPIGCELVPRGNVITLLESHANPP